MKKIGILIVTCVLFLHTIHTEQARSEIHTDYDWTFEPEVDGSLHVEVKITLDGNFGSFGFQFSKSTPIENMKAWEEETGDLIDISETAKGDKIEYILEFKKAKKGRFQFIMECDISEIVKEMYEEVYSFSWNWTSSYETSHMATVVLPQNHELLYTDYLDIEGVSSHRGTLHVVFTDDVSEGDAFRFAVVFSQKGFQLLKEAETNFNLGQYEEAKKAYKDAITFYLRFPGVYNRDIASFLLDLEGHIKGCDNKLAEEKYEAAMAAFNSGDYTTAKQLFEQAQNLYKSVGDSGKFDECQDFIDQCTQLLEQEQLRNEAEQLFNEGVTLFEQQQYEEAKAKFEEALAKYTELQDEEKIHECQDWISSCEKELKGFCIGSILIFTTLLGAFLVGALKSCRSGQ